MKCRKCNKQEATTHFKRVVNGVCEEYFLCSDCAHEMGFDNVFDTSIPDMFGGLIQSIFSTALPSRSQATRCNVCGSTYGDITNTGKVGCAACYETFLTELLPYVKRIHGNTVHAGKRPDMSITAGKESQEESKKSKISQLKDKLSQAVSEQNFELAAQLRDEIKEMEGK